MVARLPVAGRLGCLLGLNDTAWLLFRAFAMFRRVSRTTATWAAAFRCTAASLDVAPPWEVPLRSRGDTQSGAQALAVRGNGLVLRGN